MLATIAVMREEGVAVEPFTTFPRRGLGVQDSSLLLDYVQVTPEIAYKKIVEERMHRLRAFYKTINATELKDPFLL